jgi:hypothetical protein
MRKLSVFKTAIWKILDHRIAMTIFLFLLSITLFTLGVTVEYSCPNCLALSRSIMVKISYVTFILALFSIVFLRMKKTGIIALIDIMIVLAVGFYIFVGVLCSARID